MHGAGRDPDRYRNEWRALADTNAFILITPGFDKKNFPKSRSYNYGGFRDADGDLRPRDEWTFAACDPLLREVRQRTGTTVETFGSYGHSAGERKSVVEGKSVAVPVARGGRRVIKKKSTTGMRKDEGYATNERDVQKMTYDH